MNKKLNETKLMFSLGTLKHFINNALDLSYEDKKITGFELIQPILEASSCNTYMETVSNKTDTLYGRLKESFTSMSEEAYLNYIKRMSKGQGLEKKEVILAFDYTNENFYGKVQGLNVHGWTGERGITGHYKFITCSIISEDIPEKIPLISVPIRIGHYKSHVINECLSKIKDLVGDIKLIIFDRGFYDRDLMYSLSKNKYNYLIFVPKGTDKKSILYPMDTGEKISIYNEFKINKDFGKEKGNNILIFLKEIYDSKSEKNYDWVFATNTNDILLEDIIVMYKKRWRIETQFRVQDDANIKCKSKEMKIRYFLFLFEQMLQSIWMAYYKDKCSFKYFIISMEKMSKKWTKTTEK